MGQRHLMGIFLGISSLVLVYFIFQIFRPFLLPIFIASLLVSLLYPIFEWTRRRLGGRGNLAALLNCLGLTLVILVPTIILIVLLAQEAAQVYTVVQHAVERGDLEQFLQTTILPYLQPWIEGIQERFGLQQFDPVSAVTSGLQQLGMVMLRGSTALLSSFVSMLTSFVIMLLTMFFLFRDGDRLVTELKSWTPLTTDYESLFVVKFREVANATIVGNGLTSLAQGATATLVYWGLGIPNVILWGSLTALLSLVPVFGTALIWVPWTIYFLANGLLFRAILLVILSVFLVGTIDNFLRPILIEGRTKMHTLVVFFAIMGGIAYFGVIGLILGPIIVALGLTLLEIYKIEFRDQLIKTD